MSTQSVNAGDWLGLESSDQLPRYQAILSEIRRDDWVLDVGCGGGVLGVYLRESGHTGRYRGIEPNPAAAEKARSILGHHSVECVDESEYSDEPGRWEVIVFTESLYYMPDPIGTLRRYSKLLSPSGALIISIYLRQERHRWTSILRRAVNRRRPVSNLHCAEMVSAYLSDWRDVEVRDVEHSSRLRWRVWTARH